jgi:hypothetical protein
MSQTIAVQNCSTVTTDSDASNWVAAIQVALDSNFSPAWDLPAQLVFIPSDMSIPIPPGAWNVFLLDNSDMQGALGYHGLDGNGLPFARAFIADDLAAGASPTVTLSHEIFEMLVDPYIQLLAGDPTQGQLVPTYEVGDPVEADANGYLINGVLISDFALPSWFTVPGTVAGPFDFTNATGMAGQLAPGGYMTYYDPSQGMFVQNFGQTNITPNPARDRRGRQNPAAKK